MKQLVVLSGKGGTGKTTVAAALAPLAARDTTLVLADADVDASNLQLLLSPEASEEHAFLSGQIATIDPELCASCGTCAEVCRFDAVIPPPLATPDAAYRIDTTGCEGCATCFHACPMESIQMKTVQAGSWYRSETRFGPLFHARLFAGRENSGKLVTEIRQRAADAATTRNAPLVIVDGPPGIGCPVISAITGADLALVVAEPTVSGEHDLERVLGVAKHFGVSSAVVINKADLNPSRAEAIESYCREREIPVLGRLPYDQVVTDSIVRGVPLTEYDDGALHKGLSAIWRRLRDSLLQTGPLRVLYS